MDLQASDEKCSLIIGDRVHLTVTRDEIIDDRTWFSREFQERKKHDLSGNSKVSKVWEYNIGTQLSKYLRSSYVFT